MIKEGFRGIFKKLHPNPCVPANKFDVHALETYLFFEYKHNLEVSTNDTCIFMSVG